MNQLVEPRSNETMSSTYQANANHDDSDDVVFDLMMKKLAAFKATGEFGAEFTPDQFPIFIGFPPAGHPFPTAFSAHSTE